MVAAPDAGLRAALGDAAVPLRDGEAVQGPAGRLHAAAEGRLRRRAHGAAGPAAAGRRATCCAAPSRSGARPCATRCRGSTSRPRGIDPGGAARRSRPNSRASMSVNRSVQCADSTGAMKNAASPCPSALVSAESQLQLRQVPRLLHARDRRSRQRDIVERAGAPLRRLDCRDVARRTLHQDRRHEGHVRSKCSRHSSDRIFECDLHVLSTRSKRQLHGARRSRAPACAASPSGHSAATTSSSSSSASSRTTTKLVALT